MTSTPRILTPSRVVALALVALLVAGLGYVRFGRGADAPNVPHGAHAGQLTVKSCTYKTEAGPRAADCGTLVVHENRRDARSRLIGIPVIRIHARAAHPAE